VDPSIDMFASIALTGALALTFFAHVVSSFAAGHPLVAARVEREPALPLVGRVPMHAVYRALFPLGRALVALGVSANAVSLAALAFAVLAASAFATGHFGVAALAAAVASLADGLDGLVARLAGTQSRFGQVLDTTVDRYVDALFLGGIAMYVRFDAALLGLTLAAIVGAFMVSYASSVERELGLTSGPVAMRRVHRLAYLILGSTFAPLVGQAFADSSPRAELAPIVIAVGAIAIVGNISAVRRLLSAARLAQSRDSAPASAPDALESGSSLPAGAPRSRA